MSLKFHFQILNISVIGGASVGVGVIIKIPQTLSKQLNELINKNETIYNSSSNNAGHIESLITLEEINAKPTIDKIKELKIKKSKNEKSIKNVTNEISVHIGQIETSEKTMQESVEKLAQFEIQFNHATTSKQSHFKNVQTITKDIDKQKETVDKKFINNFKDLEEKLTTKTEKLEQTKNKLIYKSKEEINNKNDEINQTSALIIKEADALRVMCDYIVKKQSELEDLQNTYVGAYLTNDIQEQIKTLQEHIDEKVKEYNENTATTTNKTEKNVQEINKYKNASLALNEYLQTQTEFDELKNQYDDKKEKIDKLKDLENKLIREKSQLNAYNKQIDDLTQQINNSELMKQLSEELLEKNQNSLYTKTTKLKQINTETQEITNNLFKKIYEKNQNMQTIIELQNELD